MSSEDRTFRTAVLVLLVAILGCSVYLISQRGPQRLDIVTHQSARGVAR